jgi:ribosomal protein L17
MMMIDILRHETLTSDEEEELQEYTETLITMGKYALCNHGKTKSARIQKRNVFSTDKNEM